MAQTQLAAAELAPQAEEVFTGLWTSLFQTPPTPPKSVLVCSSDRREGSTTVACGLALAGARGAIAPEHSGEDQDDQIAEAAPVADGRVVLVDFNLRSPGVGGMLNIANGTGISNVLVGQAELDGALQRIGPGNLNVLTAGNQCRRVLEIFQANRIRPILEQLQQRYEQVIIDTSPANHYPDAQILAEVVDSVVLVAHCRQTPRETLLLARRRIELGGGKVAGIVLNKRTYPIPRFVYRRV